VNPAGLGAHFLLEPGIVFLNHGSFGARPREVVEEQARFRLAAEAEPVRFLSRLSGELLESALGRLAAFVGAPARDLAFVENATTGIGIAAKSLALESGDEVIGTDHEYGACAEAWRRACKASGASYRAISVPLPYAGDADFIGRLERAIGPRTKVLFVSHVTSPTALEFPVTEVCRLARERGLVSVIDGAHVPGQLALDLSSLGADFYTGNCHKWLCGPLGSAFLYVRAGLHELVEPPVVSWGLVDESEGTAVHDSYAGSSALARRLRWMGTRDISAFLAVPAAIEFSARHAGEGRRCAMLAAETARKAASALGLESLAREGSELRMALVPLPECDPARLKAALFGRYRIEVPVTGYGGSRFVRLSFHIYNDEGDAAAFLGALGELFPGGKPAF
jgi:isopenicillin-N epimerase